MRRRDPVHPVWRRLLIGFAVIVFIGAAGLGGRTLLAVAAVDLRDEGKGPVFLDRYGERIVSRPTDLQAYLPLRHISPHVQEAVVAMEDARFWHHPGIDPIGILRASLAYWRDDGALQGGSTITQQLAKNVFLTPERTLARKLREAALALALEVRYSKEDILEFYLNRAYFGEGAYGIEAAARTYFDKSARELTLGEAALLVGLLPAPNRYSPFRDLSRALERQRIVLQRMARLGAIDRAEADATLQESLSLAEPRTGPTGYFTDYVTERLVEHLGPHLTFQGQLEVLTTLDPDVQARASAALARSGYQGAIVVLDLLSGDILAMVGGRNYRESQFNRAVQARRQPGSAFKPFVYAAALERHWAANALLDDERRAYGSYRPTNWGQRYHGRVTMNYALAQSLNLASIWLLEKIGPRAAMDMATRLGIDTLTGEDGHLALALGGLRHGVTPLRLAEAYTAFATGGVLRKGRSILHVKDREGREWPVREIQGPTAPRVLSAQIAFVMTHMLQQVVERGTGTAARLPVEAAGKTGSTNDNRDAWFVGYTPRYLAAVFIGHDDNRPLPGGGGALAAPVWREVMEPLAAADDRRSFPIPHGIVTLPAVDIETGLRAGPGCARSLPAAFLRGTEPTEQAPCAQGGRDDDDEPDGNADGERESAEDRHAQEGRDVRKSRRDAPAADSEDAPPADSPEGDGLDLLFLRRLLKPNLARPSPPLAPTDDDPGAVGSDALTIEDHDDAEDTRGPGGASRSPLDEGEGFDEEPE